MSLTIYRLRRLLRKVKVKRIKMKSRRLLRELKNFKKMKMKNKKKKLKTRSKILIWKILTKKKKK
jgi:hypothetical protein